jgi:hypothetical protein
MRFESIVRSTVATLTLLGSVSLAHAGDDKPEEGKPFETTYYKLDGFKPELAGKGWATILADKYKQFYVKPSLSDFKGDPLSSSKSGPCLESLPLISTTAFMPESVGIGGFNLALPVFSAECHYDVAIKAGLGSMSASGGLTLFHELKNAPGGIAPWMNETYAVDAMALTSDTTSHFDGKIVIFNEQVDSFDKTASTTIRYANGWTFWETVSWGVGQKVLGQYLGVNFDAAIEGGIDWDVRAGVSDTHAVVSANLRGKASLSAQVNGKWVGGSNLQLIDELLTSEARAYAKPNNEKKELQLCISGKVESKGKALVADGLTVDLFVDKFTLVNGYGGIPLDAVPFNQPEWCTAGVPYHF